MRKSLSTLMAVGMIFVGMTPSVQGNENCPSGTNPQPLRGKIFNNALLDGTTLGTVYLIMNDQKMKCGIKGVRKEESIGSFIHTIVCDDQATDSLTVKKDTVHSQLTLHTSFVFADFRQCSEGVPGAYFGPFEEISIPVALPEVFNRGIFQNTAGGLINVTGKMNCALSIDMDFSGYVCLPDKQKK